MRRRFQSLLFAAALLPLAGLSSVAAKAEDLLKIGVAQLSAGGLPQWPAKGLVVVGFVMLSFQGISEIIKTIAIMRGDLEDHEAALGHAAAAEAEAQRLLDQAKEQGLAS